MTAAIRDRVSARMRYEAGITEWQTKQLAVVIASTVPLDEKQARKGNPLQPLIDGIRLFPEDTKANKAVEVVSKDWTPDDEPLALKRAREGEAGSFERYGLQMSRLG